MGSPTIKDDEARATLQRNVRQILATMELSENMLATRANVSQKHVNNITNGRYGCNIDTVAYIAKALGVPTWYLMVPGAGAAFEDARRIATITEGAVKASPEQRIMALQTVKKFAT